MQQIKNGQSPRRIPFSGASLSSAEKGKIFSAARDAISKLDSAPDEKSLIRELLSVVGRYGFNRLLAGGIPVPNTPLHKQSQNIILNHWPIEWAQRYFTKGYLDNDPAILRIRSSENSFVWRDLSELTESKSIGRRVMQEAADFGLKDGITMPFHPIDGGVIGFSLVGDKIELPSEARSVLLMLSGFVIARAIVLDSNKEEIKLTQRELEILKFLADGKSAWEISTIFSTSENTVNNQLSGMRVKFNTNKNTHMIAIAFRHRIIT